MKKIILGSAMLAMIFVVTSCGISIKDLEKPESVTVKSNAKYEFTIGEKEFDLGEYFDLSSMIDSFGKNDGSNSDASKMEFLQYNPDDKSEILQFLMQVNFQEINLDLKSQLEKTDFSTSFDTMKIARKEITVPEVSLNKTQTFDVKINEKINTLVKFVGLVSPKTDLVFNFDGVNGFDSITYKTGVMEISGYVPDLGLGLPVQGLGQKITGKVKLLHNDVLLTEATFNNEGYAYLNLNGVTINVEGMTLVFESETNGIGFMGYVMEGGVIDNVAGLTLSEPVSTSIETDISMGNTSALKSCEIDEGTLALNLALPAEWQGMSLNYSLDMTGGIEASTSNENEVMDLHGKSFKNEDIHVNAEVTLSMNKATLAFLDSDGNTVNPSIGISVEINKVKSATVNFDSNFETKFSKEQSLGDAASLLKGVKWNPSGLIIEYTNTLPEGNGLDITVSSNFFGMVERTESIVETPADTPAKINFLCDADKEINIGTGDGEYSSIDISAEMSLTGYDADTKTFTVYNVRPGETYIIDFSVTPVIDWQEIAINSDISAQSGKISTEFNISSIFSSLEETVGKDFVSKIKFNDIPLYIFCSVPSIDEIFENPKFVGTIKAYSGDKDCNLIEGTPITYLLGSETENGILTNANIPNLIKNEAGEVTNNLVTELSQCTSVNLKELLNNPVKDGSLCVDYNVEFQTGKDNSGIVITPATLDKLKETDSTSIKLAAMIIVPLSLSIQDTIDLNINELMNKKDGDDSEENPSEKNSDLLNRKEGETLEWEKYVDLVEKISIVYKTSKLPFIFNPAVPTDNLGIYVDFDGEGAKYGKKVLNIAGDTLTECPVELLDIYPLSPELGIVIPKGDLMIPREMNFAARVSMAIETNGEVKVWEKNKATKGGN